MSFIKFVLGLNKSMKLTGSFQTVSVQKFFFLITVFCIYLVAASAHAEQEQQFEYTGNYYGMQYSSSTSVLETASGNISKGRGHFKGKLGHQLTDLLSVEGQAGFTTTSDFKDGLLTYGAYLKAEKKYSKYKLYGIAGLGGIYNYLDNEDSVSEAGFSYGIGFSLFATKTRSIDFEYVKVVDSDIEGDDFSFETFGIGYTYFFYEDKSSFNKNTRRINRIRDL